MVASFSIWQIIIIIAIYVIVISGIHIYEEGKERSKTLRAINRQLIETKNNISVWELLLSEQPAIETEEVSNIVFGKPEATNILTIVCNPYCKPCAETHNEICSILNRELDLKVQYILTSQNNIAECASVFLCKAYFTLGKDSYRVFSLWFDDNENKEQIIKDYDEVLENNKKSLEEIERHSEWIKRHGILTTPSIFYNGRRLPSVYSISDIKYFLFE